MQKFLERCEEELGGNKTEEIQKDLQKITQKLQIQKRSKEKAGKEDDEVLQEEEINEERGEVESGETEDEVQGAKGPPPKKKPKSNGDKYFKRNKDFFFEIKLWQDNKLKLSQLT